MPPPRLAAEQLRDHLLLESDATRRLVEHLRRIVLRAAPQAAEAIKFGALSYFHLDAPFGSIGGNICMIDVKRGQVTLGFILGAKLHDPRGLLRGSGKSKRFVPIADRNAAADPRLVALIRDSAERSRPD